ncbi:PDZ domain-containing protein [Amycolatopsis sp. NPDC051071]|uniref:YlbL family protein n=1 Tax=Amycolatopsis sp. NPDC051071 TaxID=3154637 RepID=UPI0034406EF6
MTEPSEETTAARSRAGSASDQDRSERRLTRRGWTLLVSGALFVAFALVGFFIPVPYVAISPGPTYDTLGKDAAGQSVIQVNGHEVFQTSGELRMTTVSLRDGGITLFNALGLWASGRYALAPREEYFKPGETNEQVRQENIQQLQDSQTAAQVAALRRKFPVKVLTKTIVSGSPADKVLAPGDRLTVVNGKTVAEATDVRAALNGTKPGQTVQITFKSDGQAERTVPLTLAQRPDGPEGFMGLTAVDRADVPFDVKISLQDVGGPSAGLMFALAIVDKMEQGDLAGGRHIAGTGEISEKGVVGAIGGISFKVVGAREAGASDFLVPAHNCAEAKTAAPDGLNLIKVSTLDEAIVQLENLKAGRPTASC